MTMHRRRVAGEISEIEATDDPMLPVMADTAEEFQNKDQKCVRFLSCYL